MELYLHATLYDLMSWFFVQGKRRILLRLTTSMEQNPSSETSRRSTTERFDSVHKGRAVVLILSQMISSNIATSYNTHVYERS